MSSSTISAGTIAGGSQTYVTTGDESASLPNSLSLTTANTALPIPAGTTGQRPANSAGLIRYNSTNGAFEGNDGSAWAGLGGGGSGAWELISTSVASSSSSISFTGLSSDYINYSLVLSDVTPTTNNVGMILRTSINNGASYSSGGSDYTWSILASLASAVPSASSASSGMTIISTASGLGAGNGANEKSSGEITIYSPSSVNYTKISSVIAMFSQYANIPTYTAVGARISTAAVNAIQILYTSGTIASGTFKLYGLSAS